MARKRVDNVFLGANMVFFNILHNQVVLRYCSISLKSFAFNPFVHIVNDVLPIEDWLLLPIEDWLLLPIEDWLWIG